MSNIPFFLEGNQSEVMYVTVSCGALISKLIEGGGFKRGGEGRKVAPARS